MPQNAAFQWSEAKLKAAALVADGEQTEAEIAAACGVDRRTVQRWGEHPTFAAKVDAIRTRFAEEAVEHPIARRAHRIAQLQDFLDRVCALIVARGEQHAAVPGGATGLLVEEVTERPGKYGMTITRKYAFDAALTREMREAMKQAAIETGQWTEKRELSGKDGGPIDFNLMRDQLAEKLAGIVDAGTDDGVRDEPQAP